jgi:hypothetical protein
MRESRKCVSSRIFLYRFGLRKFARKIVASSQIDDFQVYTSSCQAAIDRGFALISSGFSTSWTASEWSNVQKS